MLTSGVIGRCVRRCSRLLILPLTAVADCSRWLLPLPLIAEPGFATVRHISRIFE
jgi:hypothetical protein